MTLHYKNSDTSAIEPVEGTSGAAKMILADSTVVQPTDIQAQYRPLIDSTVTNLAAAATYTSASLDVSKLKEVTLMVFSNEATEWKVEQSWDGTNWDVVPAVTTRTASEKTLIAPIRVVGTKVRYTVKNTGASTTTTLRAALMGVTV